MTEDRKKCFVIMPFSKTREEHTEEYWKRHFFSFLKPLIEEKATLKAYRSEPLRGDIASQIITDLVSADIVVAELTDHNPNVLWELGVRQSFKQCTVTIAEKGTQIPFHFSHKGILFYNGDHLDNKEFEETFIASLTNCIECPNEPDSPVLEAMGGRGTLYSIIHAEENKRKLDALKMEIEYNKILVVEIYENIEKNISIRLKWKESSEKKELTRMSCGGTKTSAVEYLIVNRYLDLEEGFYRFLTNYQAHFNAINEHLVEWSRNALHSEQYLIETKNRTLENNKMMDEYIDRAYSILKG
ncbi:MAG: hypothetical protein ABR909_12430 [Candidatus Bathyarchaeia archaeon]